MLLILFPNRFVISEPNPASFILATCCILRTKRQARLLPIIIVNAASFHDIEARLNKLEKRDLQD